MSLQLYQYFTKHLALFVVVISLGWVYHNNNGQI